MSNRRLFVALATLGVLVAATSFWTMEAPPVGVPAVHAAPVTMVFAGDIMLDRNVAVFAGLRGTDSLFASTSALFASSTLRVANLEGTITTNPSIAQANHTILQFTFDPMLARVALAPLNLSAVSQANNHALDFGESGYESTKAYLAGWGISSFGDPFNRTGRLTTVLPVPGQPNKQVCLIGYMQLFAPATTTVVDEIQRARPMCWRVVVFAHWGVEYSHDVTQAQRAAAHQFVDAGADLVVGAHPHVVEPIEVYQGHLIAYSLGNFMFDQNFSWDVEHGLVLQVAWQGSSTVATMVPVGVADERSTIDTGADRAKTLQLVGLPGAVDSLELP